jgi:hypothetical protein
MNLHHSLLALALAIFSTASLAQASIDHNKALAGSVTPGDAPGYPITLSQPGHYKLSGNLVTPLGVPGVVITALNVTLDLNGFSVRGPGVCTRNTVSRKVSCFGQTQVAAVGVVMGNGSRLLNGAIRGFFDGVSLADGNVLDDLLIEHNARQGIDTPNNYSTLLGTTVRHVRAFMNGGLGLSMPRGKVSGSSFNANATGSNCPGCLIVDSIAMDNEYFGFTTGAVSQTRAESNGLKNYDHAKSLGGNLDGATLF